jgi:hypothetical protein
MIGSTHPALAANPAVFLTSLRKRQSRKQSLCCKPGNKPGKNPGNNPNDTKHPSLGCRIRIKHPLKHLFFRCRICFLDAASVL